MIPESPWNCSLFITIQNILFEFAASPPQRFTRTLSAISANLSNLNESLLHVRRYVFERFFYVVENLKIRLGWKEPLAAEGYEGMRGRLILSGMGKQVLSLSQLVENCVKNLDYM